MPDTQTNQRDCAHPACGCKVTPGTKYCSDYCKKALKVPPPDLTTLAQRNKGTFPADRVEAFVKGERRLSTPAHGSSDMPVWGPIFKGLDNRDAINAARIENIVRYIESIQAKAKA